MKNKLLRLLTENARRSDEELAELLGVSAAEVKAAIADLESRQVIRGYRAIVNDGKAGSSGVRALIEVKVTPQRDGGFDAVARRLSKYPEVTDLYLVAGHYDLRIEVTGRNLEEVAAFVYEKLATTEGVNSTATIFLLKKYKESGHLMEDDEEYERLEVTP